MKANSSYAQAEEEGGLSHDYGELDDTPYYMEDHGASIGYLDASGERKVIHRSASSEEATATEQSAFQQQKSKLDEVSNVAATKAKEIGSSFQAGASRWFKSTKEWLMENTNSTDTGQEEKAQRTRTRRPRFPDTMIQNQVVVCVGDVVTGNIDPSQPWTRALYRTLPVRVPSMVAGGQEFVVALPTGEARDVTVPMDMKAGDPMSIAYNGYISDSFGVEYSDEDDGSNKPRRLGVDERLIEFYRRHNPEERDALMQRTEHGFGFATYEGEFGAHIHHAYFAGVQTTLAADDVVVNANGEPVQSKRDLEIILEAVPVGEYVTLGLLRKSPSPIQRCPAGHPLVETGARDPLPFGSTCNRCERGLFSIPKVYRCAECDWSMCDSCHESIFANMNTGRNANRGDPEWAKDYEEAFGKTLNFNIFDKGTKLRIYWHTTGEWWLGEVMSYDSDRGHEILYEEGTGEAKQLSKQSIRDLSLYTYRVLTKKEAAMTVAAENKKSPTGVEEGGTLIEKDEEGEKVTNDDEVYVLTEDEKSLLQGIQLDLEEDTVDQEGSIPKSPVL